MFIHGCMLWVHACMVWTSATYKFSELAFSFGASRVSHEVFLCLSATHCVMTLSLTMHPCVLMCVVYVFIHGYMLWNRAA